MNRQMLTDLEAAAGEGATEARACEVEGRSEVTEDWKREIAWLEMSKAVRGKPERRSVIDMAWPIAPRPINDSGGAGGVVSEVDLDILKVWLGMVMLLWLVNVD